MIDIDYYDIWKIQVGEQQNRWEPAPMGTYQLRNDLASQYAWAVPTPEALQIIAKYQPLIEMGAGTGYWAYLLQQIGVDIEAYDIFPYSNRWCKRKWFNIKMGVPKILRWQSYKKNLFLCWPPYAEGL